MIGFRKKIKICPYISINLNKSIFKGELPSITVGGKGLGFNVTKDGTQGYASLDGSGVSYRTKRKKLSVFKRLKRFIGL